MTKLNFPSDFGPLTLAFDPSAHHTPEQAATAFYEALVGFCRELYGESEAYARGEMFLTPPDQTEEALGYKVWRVGWESGPYDWAIALSFQLHTREWWTEPYYGFDLCFYASEE